MRPQGKAVGAQGTPRENQVTGFPGVPAVLLGKSTLLSGCYFAVYFEVMTITHL